MPEVDALGVGAVLGEFDLDQVFRGAVRAAAHGAAFTAERDDRVGVIDAAAGHVSGFVFDPLKAFRSTRGRDVAECAFANVHEITIAPVRARREERPVVIAVVEENTLRTGREIWRRECRTHDPHQQAAPVDDVSRVMCPSVSLPPAP